MQDPTRQLLEQARDKFIAGDFSAAKRYQYSQHSKLELIGEDDKCILLNKLLADFEFGSQENCEVVFGKLRKHYVNPVNLLTQTNIDLYKNNRPNEINFINHEMLYYNIVAVAEYLGKNTLAHLVGSEALFFYQCLQTNTSLTLLYQNLRRSLIQNRFSSCLDLIHKFQKVIEHSRNMSNHEHKLKIMINVLFTCILLKLGMVEQSQALFMLKF
jgi:hypothetical protein